MSPPPRPRAEGRRRVIDRPTGRALEIELIDAPALSYGHVQWSEEDHVYAGLVRGVPRVQYDPLLGHAARELAYLYSVEDGLVPSGALEFVLLSAGAAEWGVRQSLTGTSAESLEVITERVAAITKDITTPGAIRVGVGEAYEPGARPPRTIAVIAAQGELRVDPVRKEVEPGGRVRVTGALPQGARAPRAVAMWPDLQVRDVEVSTRGGRFSLELDAMTQRGELWVELIATSEHGPKPLAQLVFYVGEPVPTAWHGGYPPDESGYATVKQCEARGYELLDTDRAEAGLAALRRHPTLDAVARAHAEDMRDHKFFGHVSPRTGDVGDRVRRAGLATIAVGENVARNSSLADAQQGLMWSLGHRVNILSRRFDHVGIGVAIDPPGAPADGRRTFFLVQVFATPAEAVDPVALRREVLQALADARRDARLAPLRLDPVLDELAFAEAQRADATPKGALDRAVADDRVHGRLHAWVSRGWNPERPNLPDSTEDDRYGRVGVGVYVDPHDTEGALRVVLLLSSD